MELRYQNNYSDWVARYNELWKNERKVRQQAYYHDVVWYLSFLILAGYVAFKADQFLVLCVFAALAWSYITKNWSFKRAWKQEADRYAELMPECTCQMRLDETGVTESFSGLTTHVDWALIPDYTLTEDYMFIPFLTSRAFVIPIRYTTSEQRDELIKQLEAHGKKARV